MSDMGLAPETAMMAVVIAASASFTSPISHPANILVMGPGGYRFVDYLKVGVPLTIVVFITVMFFPAYILAIAGRMSNYDIAEFGERSWLKE